MAEHARAVVAIVVVHAACVNVVNGCATAIIGATPARQKDILQQERILQCPTTPPDMFRLML